MEFCGVFYETGYLRAVYDRIRKLFFVFLMAAVLTVGMMGQGMETINFGSVRLKDMAVRDVAEYAAAASDVYKRQRRICGGSRNNRFFYDFGNRDSDFGRCFS